MNINRPRNEQPQIVYAAGLWQVVNFRKGLFQRHADTSWCSATLCPAKFARQHRNARGYFAATVRIDSPNSVFAQDTIA